MECWNYGIMGKKHSTNRTLVFSIIFLLQLIFYLLAIAGSVKPIQRNMIPRLANFFILLNLMIIMGWFNYIRGKDFTIWDKIQSSR